jgi:hypothetical protein
MVEGIKPVIFLNLFTASLIASQIEESKSVFEVSTVLEILRGISYPF